MVKKIPIVVLFFWFIFPKSNVVLAQEAMTQEKAACVRIAEGEIEKAASTIAEAKKNIARLYYNKGDYPKSLEIWQEILSKSLDDKEVLIDIGRIFFHLGDSEKAQEYFSKAWIGISPEGSPPKKVPLVYETQIKGIAFDLKCK